MVGAYLENLPSGVYFVTLQNGTGADYQEDGSQVEQTMPGNFIFMRRYGRYQFTDMDRQNVIVEFGIPW